MPVSPPVPAQTRFFGLDLASLGRDLLVAWQGMFEWPVVSWLWPKSDIRLWLPNGGMALSRGLKTPVLFDNSSVNARNRTPAQIRTEIRAKAARFEAVVLPESLLLRRTLTLPPLQDAQMQSALALEVQSLSPFAPDEVVWAYHSSPQPSVGVQVQVVISSRKLIAQHVALAHPQVTPQNAEVWVNLADGLPSVPHFAALPGYGEARRQRQTMSWRWASGFLVALAAGLFIAIAVTPTVRLYLKSVQASQALAVVAKKASPVIEQRESLLRITQQVSSLNKLVDKPVPALQTLTLITQALPDDTSLLSLQMQGLKVSMTGQTANAASLMKQLGTTAGLRDVKAPVPATKPLGATREQFTIEFTLDPEQIPSSLKAAL